MLRFAAEAGLDVARLEADMKTPEIAALIERNMDLAEALNIRGTPAFVIGDVLGADRRFPGLLTLPRHHAGAV